MNHERELFSEVEVDIEGLKLDLLDEEDKKVLKTGMLILYLELSAEVQKDGDESSISTLHDSKADIIAPTTMKPIILETITSIFGPTVIPSSGTVSRVSIASASSFDA